MRFVLVSLDPARDDVSRLADYAAERALEKGPEPKREIPARFGRHVLGARIGAGQRVDQGKLGRVEPRGAEAVAVAGANDGAAVPFLEQREVGKQAAARIGDGARAPEPPVERAERAQHATDKAPDRGAGVQPG